MYEVSGELDVAAFFLLRHESLDLVRACEQSTVNERGHLRAINLA